MEVVSRNRRQIKSAQASLRRHTEDDQTLAKTGPRAPTFANRDDMPSDINDAYYSFTDLQCRTNND
jgi:hypothetical protein